MTEKKIRSVYELRNRRAICAAIVKVLQTECAGDPRQKDALPHYIEQLKKLDAELTEAERLERQRLGIPEPEPIVIGLKPAILFPREGGQK